MIIAIKTRQQNKPSILYLIFSWDIKTSKDAIWCYFCAFLRRHKTFPFVVEEFYSCCLGYFMFIISMEESNTLEWMKMLFISLLVFYYRYLDKNNNCSFLVFVVFMFFFLQYIYSFVQEVQLPVHDGITCSKHALSDSDRWFSPCTPVSSTNETGRNDIT